MSFVVLPWLEVVAGPRSVKARKFDSTPILHKLRHGELLAGEHVVDDGSVLANSSAGHTGFDHHFENHPKISRSAFKPTGRFHHAARGLPHTSPYRESEVPRKGPWLAAWRPGPVEEPAFRALARPSGALEIRTSSFWIRWVFHLLLCAASVAFQLSQ